MSINRALLGLLIVSVLVVGFSFKGKDVIVVPKDASIMISLGNTPWAGLPPYLKELIAKKSANTKLNKSDLLQLSVYYSELAKSCKEPISLRTLSIKK